MTNPNTEEQLKEAIERARQGVRATLKLTPRQAEELEALEAVRGHTANFASSPHSVLEALARRGFVTFDREQSPQHRGYQLTVAGQEVLRPVLEARRALRAFRDSAHTAQQEEGERRAARAALKLDEGSSYATSAAVEAEVRRELGLDAIFAAATTEGTEP